MQDLYNIFKFHVNASHWDFVNWDFNFDRFNFMFNVYNFTNYLDSVVVKDIYFFYNCNYFYKLILWQ